jgi:hypothetical protein
MRGVGWGIVVTTADGWGGSVAHNRIAMEPNNGLGSAISVGGAGTFGADVIANYISGKGYGSGIYVSQSIGAPGTITTRILGNLVVGDPTGPGASYAIDLVGGTATFVVDVADNTVADDVDGIDLVGTTVSGEVANNIVSGNTYSGISIAPALAATVPNKNNLVYGDGMESFTPGPGTVTLDPRFAGGGDYHLLPDSPAIDAGASSAVPSDLLTDLDGNPRIQGHRVDIGAYEAPEPTGALGGGAALLALARAVRSRRRSTRASERSA